jgi:hypothetical protein
MNHPLAAHQTIVLDPRARRGRPPLSCVPSPTAGHCAMRALAAWRCPPHGPPLARATQRITHSAT